MEHKSNSTGSYETRDVDLKKILIFWTSLTIFIIASLVFLYFLFMWFNAHIHVMKSEAWQRPLPPEPRLQAKPALDLKHFRETEERLMSEYAWVDQPAGLVRIPVKRAMELLLNRNYYRMHHGSRTQ